MVALRNLDHPPQSIMFLESTFSIAVSSEALYGLKSILLILSDDIFGQLLAGC